VTVDEIVADQVAAFQADGLAWYDGMSWLTAEVASAADRDAAYERVFAKLIENGRAAGMRDPVIAHAGNGHYAVVEGDLQEKPSPGGSRGGRS
jgi:hypothetical protein